MTSPTPTGKAATMSKQVAVSIDQHELGIIMMGLNSIEDGWLTEDGKAARARLAIKLGAVAKDLLPIPAAESVRCVWCETELAPEDAKPVKYARVDDAPDSENKQCKDEAACARRQARLGGRGRY